MLVKPFYAIDISHWVVRLEIDAQQKNCKAECTLLPLPLSTTVLLTIRVMLRPHRATALLTRHPTAPKQATQADLKYPPPHLRLLNQHRTESPLEACETATSIQQVQTVPIAPASTLNNNQHDTGLSSFVPQSRTSPMGQKATWCTTGLFTNKNKDISPQGPNSQLNESRC